MQKFNKGEKKVDNTVGISTKSKKLMFFIDPQINFIKNKDDNLSNFIKARHVNQLIRTWRCTGV
jgi:hypothetical protein